MASNGTPQSYLYSQRPRNRVEDKSMQQNYTNTGNPYGYVPQMRTGTNAGQIPQNQGNAQQPNPYNPQFQSQVQNRFIPPTYQNGQWSNQGLQYQLPSGYGPYNNNGYQMPYFNQQMGGYGSMGGYGGYNPYQQGMMNPAQQLQYSNPYMPQFNQQQSQFGYNPYSQMGGMQGGMGGYYGGGFQPQFNQGGVGGYGVGGQTSLPGGRTGLAPQPQSNRMMPSTAGNAQQLAQPVQGGQYSNSYLPNFGGSPTERTMPAPVDSTYGYAGPQSLGLSGGGTSLPPWSYQPQAYAY